MKSKKEKLSAEFRRDLVSNEWILISPGRESRPNLFRKKPKECPFDDPQKSGNGEPSLWYSKSGKGFKNWSVQVISNKYPLLSKKNSCAVFDLEGMYQKVEAIGHHDVVITRKHNKPIQKMPIEDIVLLLKTYRERYKILEKDDCVEYILIFHNHGKLAGASVEHPHSQIAALPIIPPDVSKSIEGGASFFKKHGKCVHCAILEREIKEDERIVYKNDYFVTVNPYASKVQYETRIFPLKHNSNFDEIPDNELPFLAQVLKDALIRLGKILKNPDYNFFIHTASARVKNTPDYHWHLEILPHTYKWAGLELGSGIEAVTVSPEKAAESLKSVRVLL